MPKFTKKEKLCSQKDIKRLFTEGKVFNHFPFKVLYFVSSDKSEQFPAQITFMVPKKIFNKAVDRNLIKRRMRESYRLNKEKLYNFLIDKKIYLTISIIYVDKEIKESDFLKDNIDKMMQRIIQII